MKIKELKLQNFRGLRDTSISFKPGFNLIVGVNGAGKSSILDAIRISLNQVWPKLFGKSSPKSNLGYELQDIHVDAPFLNTQLFFTLGKDETYNFDIVKHRETFFPSNSEDKKTPNIKTQASHRILENIYEKQGSEIHDKAELLDRLGNILDSVIVKSEPSLPLFLFLSVDRSRASNKSTRVNKGIETAWLESFHSNRGLNIQEVSSWWAAREILSKENPKSLNGKHLQVLKTVLAELLPEYDEWTFYQHGDENSPGNYDLIVNKTVSSQKINAETSETYFEKEKKQLFLSQLSDGERSIASIIFDIARRLMLLNPKAEDPIKTGHGIVLIDEIDLHLHPKWQREVIEKFRTIFPNIQFILTSHSPFVIQSLRDGELITLDSEITEAYSNQSIEDVAEDIQGIDLPQRTKRYKEMMIVASEYYRKLKEAERCPQLDLEKLKNELDLLTVRFSSDPFFAATIDFKWEAFTALRKAREP